MLHSAKNVTDVFEDAIDVGAEDVTEEDEGLVRVGTVMRLSFLTPGIR